MLLNIFLFIIILVLKHINFFYTLINIKPQILANKLVLLKIFQRVFGTLPLNVRLALNDFSRVSLVQGETLNALC